MLYKSYQIENNVNSLSEKVCLFYGENLGLKNDFKNEIKKTNLNSEILNFFQEEILKEENLIFKEINNLSLFDKNKIFFIQNVNDKILDILVEAEKNLQNQKIFLFADILDKKSKLRNYVEKSENCASIPCYEDNEITIKKIIKEKLKDFINVSVKDINIIIEHTGLDRIKLSNELNKIISCFQNKKIDHDKLELLLNIKENDNFNKLKDQALIGNELETNKLLSDTVIDAEKNIFYLNLVNQRLNRLREVEDVETKKLEYAINSLKPPLFWKDKPNFTIQAKKWNKNKIKNILKKTYIIEKDIKSNSVINKNILIKNLMVDICKLANS